MLKFFIPLILIVVCCFFAGAAGLKLLGVISISFCAGAGIFFLFRLFTRKKNLPKRVNMPQSVTNHAEQTDKK